MVIDAADRVGNAVAVAGDVAVAGRWPHSGSIGSSRGVAAVVDTGWSHLTGRHRHLKEQRPAIVAIGDAGADALEWLLAVGSAKRPRTLLRLLRLPMPDDN